MMFVSPYQEQGEFFHVFKSTLSLFGMFLVFSNRFFTFLVKLLPEYLIFLAFNLNAMSSAIVHSDFGQSRAAARHVSPLSTEMITVQVEGIVREKHFTHTK